ncbi:hypothetical protein C0992_012987 [Termitomyces sp. T32_za158]|nr:hypothetical protein C0992_012987 [Termitomyces sp. T32_za158]
MEHYKAHFTDKSTIQGAVVSTFNGGCFFGTMGAGWLNDKLGRQELISPQIGCVFSLWGGAMQSGASNVATLLVGRIIGGIAIGYVV